ncbi:hypothetical protein GCM10009569_00700 [Arthrobacter russicus]
MGNTIGPMVAGLFAIVIGFLVFKFRERIGTLQHEALQIIPLYRTLYKETLILWCGFGSVMFMIFGAVFIVLGIANAFR